MMVEDTLFQEFKDKAVKEVIELVYIGVGYTALLLESGSIGIAYSYFDSKKGCSLLDMEVDYEKKTGEKLLEKIYSNIPFERTVALALINALNNEFALKLEVDRDNSKLFELLDIYSSKKIAMVGFFAPIVNKISASNSEIKIIDESREIEDKDFFNYLNIADSLILTSTSILNGSFNSIIEKVKDSKVKVILIGPSTPMVKKLIDNYGISMLAGSAPREGEGVLKAVRHGKGTPIIGKYCKKVYMSKY